jgi:hypothetical protein
MMAFLKMQVAVPPRGVHGAREAAQLFPSYDESTSLLNFPLRLQPMSQILSSYTIGELP